MTFKGDSDNILWKLHLKSPPQVVYEKLSTDEGRASFWAEWKGKILKHKPSNRSQVEY